MTLSRLTLLWLLTQLELHGHWALPDPADATQPLLTITQYSLDGDHAWTVDWTQNAVTRHPSLKEALLQLPDAVLAELATYPKE